MSDCYYCEEELDMCSDTREILELGLLRHSDRHQTRVESEARVNVWMNLAFDKLLHCHRCFENLGRHMECGRWPRFCVMDSRLSPRLLSDSQFVTS